MISRVFGMPWTSRLSRRAKPGSTRRHTRPSLQRLETLESRAMLATFTVTNNSDPLSPVPGDGSFRQAILDANATAGLDTIEFRITGATTIALTSALPSITEQVFVNATTQPGYLTSPIVEVDGTAVSDAGLRITALGSGTTIRGLSLYGFQYDAALADSGNAVVIEAGSTSNAVINCYLGTNVGGSASGNAVAGILTFGDDTLIENNLISDNGGPGVILDRDTGTIIVGNRIGLDATGTAALGNVGGGILARGSSSLLVGGTTTARRNVISGNGDSTSGLGDGVRLEGAQNVQILGNYIGVDAVTGSVAISNVAAGISVDADDVAIGDGTAAGRNVISGNGTQGIAIIGGANAVVAGNYIGTSANGQVGTGNTLEGILVSGGSGHQIGGVLAGQGNFISANAGDGIAITAEATNVLVQRNTIGLGVTLGKLGNGGDGISINEATGVTVTYSNRITANAGAGVRLTGASGNLVGADTTLPLGQQGLGFGNAIYANGAEGVVLEAESNDNIVAANLIGLATPNGAIQGNAGDGIAIRGSRRNLVGGVLPASASDPVLGNVVAGNVVGVSIADADALDASDGNVVRGNQVRNNVSHAIAVDNASNQTIGGALQTDANTLTLNGGNGVEIRNGSLAITVTGNYVGTTSTGALGFGNGGAGVRVLQSNGSIIGGSTAVSRENIVVGNGSDGIVITRVDDAGLTDGDASLNVVQGNRVRANKGSGIRITSASDNLVGSTAATLGNLVTNNTLDGLRLETGADGNTVLGNTFGGAVNAGNGGVGIRITASNENMVGSAAAGGGNTVARNAGSGIVIDVARAVDLGNGNVVAGNTVDSNLGDGIVLTGSSFQTIGGVPSDPGTPENIVIRNRGIGIRLASNLGGTLQSDENLVQSNLVGTDAIGSNLGNKLSGIEIARGSFNALVANTVGYNLLSGIRIDGGGASQFNTIGGAALADGNVVFANKTGGIVIENDARSTLILSTLVTGNTGVGIAVRGGRDTTIGQDTTVTLSTSDGIRLSAPQTLGATHTLITGAFIGTDSLGTPNLGNQGLGVRITEINGAIVGPDTVVAFNTLGGVTIENSKANSLAEGNVVRGATIRDNRASGITVTTNSAYQTIGGTTIGDGNTISGNFLDGIALAGNSKFVTVQGNTVVANRRHGVSLTTVNDATIDSGNEIAGNGLDGISLSSGSTRNLITGNAIGQTLTGIANGNNRDGIGINGVNGNSIVDNRIGSNLRHGVSIASALAGGPSAGNALRGNLVVANVQNGVNVTASRNQVVGGTNVDDANVIIDNGLDGIFVGSGSAAIAVTGNLIGVDEVGTDAGNGNDGIEVNNSLGVTVLGNTVRFNDANGLRVAAVRGTAAQQTVVTGNDFRSNDANGVLVNASSGTLVGNTAAGNTIGLNALAGVRIDGASSANNVVANLIGTNVAGANLGNGQDGVLVTGANGNVVRGGNTIAFNAIGVRILDAAAANLTAGNRVEGNLVRNNVGDGVAIAGGAFHTVGGVGIANTIVENGGNGVSITSSARNASTGNMVRGNLIGTDAAQTRRGNALSGVVVAGGSAQTIDQNTIATNSGAGVTLAASSANVVGSNTAGQGNLIVGNFVGIHITDTAGATQTTTRDNVVAGNLIANSIGDGVVVAGTKTLVTFIGASTVNGRLTGQANTIRDNGGYGIRLRSGSQQTSVQANAVFSNVFGPTLADPNTNTGSVTPSVTSAELLAPPRSAMQVQVKGTLTGVVAGQQYQLDVFSNLPTDGNAATGARFGGRTFLGRVTVTAATSGTMPYSITVSAAGSSLGDFISVSATNLRPPAATSSAFASIARTLKLPAPATPSTAGSSTSTPSRTLARVR